MSIGSLDDVSQEPCIGSELIRRPSCVLGVSEVVSRGRGYNANLEDDVEDDVYASMPIVEYLREQSFASFTRSSATASSVRRSSFPMVFEIMCKQKG